MAITVPWPCAPRFQAPVLHVPLDPGARGAPAVTDASWD